MRPAYMMAIESAMSSSSDRSWVMKIVGEAELDPQLLDLFEDLALGDDVESGGGLVHDDEIRAQCERHGDHDPLAHAAG